MRLRDWGYQYGLLNCQLEGPRSKIISARVSVVREHFTEYLISEGLDGNSRRNIVLHLMINGFTRAFKEGVRASLEGVGITQAHLKTKLHRFLLKVVDIDRWKPLKVSVLEPMI